MLAIVSPEKIQRSGLTGKKWTETEVQRQQELIIKTGLPVKTPANVEVFSILTALELDKKVKAGRVRFILPTRLGEVTTSDRVSPEILLPILQHQQ
ncbi:hypothetical protein [Oscillatoria sp. FACHB-1406]|uniref:hypothetical protein n=1 Tax=Oscillatoria sp. FACHB-1406 TaxID=2692846 RepID=UPI001684A8D9|nr:hypothetical protein [Oscillatoria sp. FACHB-1406]MBD2579062.1 hypothetical protein [Oscillatoria sp. FACHB-1406]